MSTDAGEERDVMLLCPFCGGGGVEMHPHDIARHGAEMPTQDGAQVQYAHCNGCGAEGPQAFTYAEAQTAWNRRAAITAYTSGSGRDLEGVEESAEALIDRLFQAIIAREHAKGGYNRGTPTQTEVEHATAAVRRALLARSRKSAPP